MEPQSYNEARTRPSLEERLESIISGAALMADSSCTRDDRRERIVQECTAVRQALQDLLSEYMTNVSVHYVHYIYLFIYRYSTYNCTHGATKLKSKCTTKLICMQRDPSYGKLTKNQDRPAQELGLYNVKFWGHANIFDKCRSVAVAKKQSADMVFYHW